MKKLLSILLTVIMIALPLIGMISVSATGTETSETGTTTPSLDDILGNLFGDFDFNLWGVFNKIKDFLKQVIDFLGGIIGAFSGPVSGIL